MREALNSAQQQLADAAKQEQAATTGEDQKPVQAQVAAAQSLLTEARDQQQKEGDQNLSQQAGAVLKQMEESHLAQQLNDLAQQSAVTPEARQAVVESLQKMANQLTAQRLAMQSEQQNLQDTLQRITRVQENLNKLPQDFPSSESGALAQELKSDLETAVVDSKALLPKVHPATDEVDHAVKGEIPKPGKLDDMTLRGPGETYQPLAELLAAFHQEVANRLQIIQTQATLSYLNPDQAPEEYRDLVSAYYERISKETKSEAKN
jgi:chromosome segregation ATPase